LINLSEVNPNNEKETQYMPHILFDNKSNDMSHSTHDKASGQYFQKNKTKKVDSAIAMTDYSSDANKKFDLI